MFYAQEEAQRFQTQYVSTEHLLLGLVREPDNVAMRVLDRLGVDPERIRAETERQIPQGAGNGQDGLTLTPRAKRCIDLAYQEARNLNDDYIGTEHLLLGLVAEAEGLAGRVLSKLGIDLERCRRTVLAIQDEEGRRNSAGPVENDLPKPDVEPTPAAWDGLVQVAFPRLFLAARQGRLPLDHLTAFWISHDPGVAALLAGFGLDVYVLQERLERCLLISPASDEAPLQPSPTEAFALAAAEAESLGQEVGGVHLLLAVLKHGGAFAAECLTEKGITYEALRRAAA